MRHERSQELIPREWKRLVHLHAKPDAPDFFINESDRVIYESDRRELPFARSHLASRVHQARPYADGFVHHEGHSTDVLRSMRDRSGNPDDAWPRSALFVEDDHACGA